MNKDRIPRCYIAYPVLIKYPLIIKVLLDNKDNEGISSISQKEIAKEIGLHQTAVCKYLKKLEQYDKCIEKIAPGQYIVHKSDMLRFGPVSKVVAFHNVAVEDPNFITLPFKEQVEKLEISKEAVTMAKQHFIQHIDKFDENMDDDEINKKIEIDFVNYLNSIIKRKRKGLKPEECDS